MSGEAPRALGIEDIDRKYELLERMGEGGMGEIYKARHILLDEVRVIKTIRAQYRGDEDLQARFLREARVATQLRHPHIVAIHDFSVGDDGTACIVMEFVRGASLAGRTREGGLLAQGEVLEIARQTLDALAYLHRRQIVHRDISPDNLMVDYDANGRPLVKLIDLGIAKPLESAEFQTRTSMFVGKIRYASPEQLGGVADGIDGRSDLYSLAVVLCELLTGSLPISGTDQASMIAGHLFHPPRSFDEIDPHGRVAPALRRVLERGLAKRPGERFATAEEFAAALAAAAGAPPPAAGAERTLLAGPAGDVAPTTLAPAPAGAAARPTVLAPAAGPTVLAPAAGPATVAPAPAPASRRGRLAALAALLLAVALGVGLYVGTQDDEDTDGRDASPDLLAGLDFGPYRALVIGIDDYQHLPRLETATRDALEVKRVLEQRYGFDVRPLLDPTRHELVTALAELTGSAGPRDNLLVYYAGHGTLDRRNDSGFWQPVDADPFDTTNWVSAKFEITPLLDQSQARHILVIADSCYAGSLETAPPPPPLPAAPQALRARLQEALGQRSRLALTSGGQSPVLDSGDGQHSIFARSLLSTLAESDGLLDAATLFARVQEPVGAAAQRLGAAQAPQLAPMPRSGDEGGGFFFVPRTAGDGATAPGGNRG